MRYAPSWRPRRRSGNTRTASPIRRRSLPMATRSTTSTWPARAPTKCSSICLETIRVMSRSIRPSRSISVPPSRASWQPGAGTIHSFSRQAPRRSSAISPTPSCASSRPGTSPWRRTPPKSPRQSGTFSPPDRAGELRCARDRTGEIRRARQPGLGKFRSRRPTRCICRGEWADLAPVNGIKCLGLVKSCPGGAFPGGAKFVSARPPQRPASKVYDVGVDDIRLLQRGRSGMISAACPYQKQRRRVLGREMAYVEVGKGDPIVLLHGNPTSSYLWRNVLPHLPRGRCIAPDLIGMGDSDKLPDSGPGSYRFVDHRRYLDALLEALDVHERVTFVVHDWGSALGFDWANRHREAVKRIAYMEAIVRPQGWDHWDVMNMRPLLQALRSDAGEKMVLQENFFIEKILPGAVLRTLTAEEMAEYRRPFAEPGEGRRPTLTWPREIPIEGEPADVNAIVTAYADWLATSDVPKLFIKAKPGALLGGGANLDTVRAWPAQTEVTVPGIHFIQEDSPDEIGQAIAGWLGTLAERHKSKSVA